MLIIIFNMLAADSLFKEKAWVKKRLKKYTNCELIRVLLLKQSVRSCTIRIGNVMRI